MWLMHAQLTNYGATRTRASKSIRIQFSIAGWSLLSGVSNPVMNDDSQKWSFLTRNAPKGTPSPPICRCFNPHFLFYAVVSVIKVGYSIHIP